MKFIENIKKIYENNKEPEIYVDMDGTIIELLFDMDESFTQKGNYIKKQSIKPVIEKITKIHTIYPDLKIKILSFSRNSNMTEEKNKWLDINMPFINNENRIFLTEEDNKYEKSNINKIKGEYIKSDITNGKTAILIDDDVRILNETKKILKEQVIPIHVTSVLIWYEEKMKKAGLESLSFERFWR